MRDLPVSPQFEAATRVRPLLLDMAKRAQDLRRDGLFGGGSDTLPDDMNVQRDEAQHHFMIALSLLEQASHHLKLAHLQCTA